MLRLKLKYATAHSITNTFRFLSQIKTLVVLNREWKETHFKWRGFRLKNECVGVSAEENFFIFIVLEIRFRTVIWAWDHFIYIIEFGAITFFAVFILFLEEENLFVFICPPVVFGWISFIALCINVICIVYSYPACVLCLLFTQNELVGTYFPSLADRTCAFQT